jgi:hypothetical protein
MNTSDPASTSRCSSETIIRPRSHDHVDLRAVGMRMQRLLAAWGAFDKCDRHLTRAELARRQQQLRHLAVATPVPLTVAE